VGVGGGWWACVGNGEVEEGGHGTWGFWGMGGQGGSAGVADGGLEIVAGWAEVSVWLQRGVLMDVLYFVMSHFSWMSASFFSSRNCLL
jgi:hypothetical protein